MVAKVVVNWSKNKRDKLPESLQYISVAKFDEDNESWNKEAWSVVLEFLESPCRQGNPSIGKAKFLAQDAPHERLISGKCFELYEGDCKVARIEIL